MAKHLALLSAIMIPSALFADGITATGQFVIAPIVSDKCVTSATTMPTSGLASDNALFKAVTYLVAKENTYPTAIEEVKQTTIVSKDKTVSGIYTMDGRKISTMQNGVNIVVHNDGSISKVMK